MTKRTSVIYDTDLCFGLPEAPLDGGLGLLYLLGSPEVTVRAVCTVGGAREVDAVMDAVAWTMRLAGAHGIPVIAGAKTAGDYATDASAFLAREAADRPGEITVITTGSLSNIRGAFEHDPEFFGNLRSLIITGGLRHRMQLPRWNPELAVRLARDPAAVRTVLESALSPVVMTLHLGSLVTVTLDDIIGFRDYSTSLYHLFQEYLCSSHCARATGKPKTYLWSVPSAIRVTHPHLFADSIVRVSGSDTVDGETQFVDAECGGTVCLPERITDLDAFLGQLHRGLAAALSTRKPADADVQGGA